eukprot:4347581-Amphidinium_carterae.1
MGGAVQDIALTNPNNMTRQNRNTQKSAELPGTESRFLWGLVAVWLQTWVECVETLHSNTSGESCTDEWVCLTTTQHDPAGSPAQKQTKIKQVPVSSSCIVLLPEATKP